MFSSLHVVRKYGSEDDPIVHATAEALQQTAEQRQMFVLDTPSKCNDKTLVVAVGGDGTMLGAMRIAAPNRSVAMGINLGRIGFLTDFVVPPFSASFQENVSKMFDDVLEFAGIVYPIESRLMLSAWHKSQTTVAGNEISISRDKSDSMITYRLIFDDTDAGIYRANSLLVSSPSGSTAYALSAGGALMMPAIQAMQVVPVASQTMTARPIVISHDTRVEVHAWGGRIATRSDGLEWLCSNDNYTEKEPFVMFVQKHGSVRVLHNSGWNYFDMLAQKLGWIKE